MQKTEGQINISSLFYRGINTDNDPELLSPDHGTVIDAHQMRLLQNGTYIRVPGDKILYGEGEDRTKTILRVLRGLVKFQGSIIEFWYKNDPSSYHSLIYIDNLLVGEHEDIPGSLTKWLDIAIDDENGDMYITDNDTFPMVFNIPDLIDSVATEKYFTEFDANAHRLQLAVGTISQPVFVDLVNINVGGGLKPGSYSYAIRYVDADGNKTNWGPATPFIPVFDNLNLSSGSKRTAMFTGGDAPSLNGTRHGIELKFRITNTSGYDHIEIKRTININGLPSGYQPSSEYIILVNDANGRQVDILNNPYDVISFVDRGGLQWLILDEGALEESVSIKKVRSIRYYDGRIVLGGIEYESRDFTLPTGLILEDAEDKVMQAVPFDIGTYGYKDPWAQTYRKSYMRGERYGFGFQLVDDFGGLTFATPYPENMNMKMPERRYEVLNSSVVKILSENYGGGSGSLPWTALIDSNTGLSTGHSYEVFSRDPKVIAQTAPLINIMDTDEDAGAFSYSPMTPTNLIGGNTGNSKTDFGWEPWSPNYEHDLGIGGALATYNFHNAFNNKVRSLGMAIAGFDATKFPRWTKGIKIVRTQAAGRVVCQGLGMYAMIEDSSLANPATKHDNRFWFFSPDIDSSIGMNPLVFNDIINNPSSYQIQLVAPLGFTSAVYAAYWDYAHNANFAVDFLSFANIIGENQIYNDDPQSEIGYGDGYVSFGRWRNYNGMSGGSNQGTALTNNINEFIFDISSAITKHGGEGRPGAVGRGQYLELVIDPPGSDAIYAYTNTLKRTNGADNDNRRFHEPIYIVNIVKTGANIVGNNINIYEDTGTYIKLRSIIGIGNGEAFQSYQLVDERWEDCCAQFPSGAGYHWLRSIEVDGQQWLDVTLEPTLVTGWLTTLESSGYFIVNGIKYYGMYIHTFENKHSDIGNIYINKVTLSFPYVLPVSEDLVVPTSGEKIEVVYNNDSPIIVFGGDTFIGEAFFAPIDINGHRKISKEDLYLFSYYQLYGAMPAWRHHVNPLYSLPSGIFNNGTDYDWVYEWYPGEDNNGYLDCIRQWVMGFICESRINLTMAYGNAFPYRHYVQRPLTFQAKVEELTYPTYYTYERLWGDEYYADYGQEYDIWTYGGFKLPFNINFDYSHDIIGRAFNKPYVGYDEKTSFLRRLHYSLEKNPGIQNSPSLRTFPPTNVYDLKKDDLGEIKILYDSISGQGRNLYSITDNGIVLLLSRKTSLADVTGDHIAMINVEGHFIQDEIWLNTSIGCPDELWRSKSEGVIQLPDNQFINALAFLHPKGVMLFYGNKLVNIIANWKSELEPLCEYVDKYQYFYTHPISTCFNERWNELWVNINSQIYVFNFYVNNWTHRLPFNYDRMLFMNDADDLPTSRRLSLFGGQDGLLYYIPPYPNQWNSDSLNITPIPYVTCIVNPTLHESLEFIDILIHSSSKPIELIMDTKYPIESPFTVLGPDARDFNPGWYLNIGKRTSGPNMNRSMQGPFLYINIKFDEEEDIQFILKALRTGFKKIVG